MPEADSERLTVRGAVRVAAHRGQGAYDSVRARIPSGAAEGNSLRQGICSPQRRPLSDLSILDKELENFPGAGNREIGGPEQRVLNAEQGIKAAQRSASSHISQGAVCNAIAAIFAAFEPVASSRGRRPGR